MKSFLRAVFLENLGLKVVSLALAFVLFLYVQGERKRDAMAGALVRLTLIPPRGKVLTMGGAEKLALQVRGSRAEVQRLITEGVRPLEIDLEGRSPGPLRFTPDMFGLAGSLTVESITPPELDVSWDDFAQRTLPLRPRIAGQPGSGYRVKSVNVEPAEVEVRGPRSVVDQIQEVLLAETRIDGRTEDAVLTARVQLPQKFVSARPDAAIVTVRVQAETVTRHYTGIVVRLRNEPPGMTVDVSPRHAQDVVLEGPAGAMKQIDVRALHAIVDLADVKEPFPSPLRLPARIEGLPKGVRQLATTPATFRLAFRRRD